MLKSNFEFEVLVHGNSAKEYYHKGNNYIEGKQGSRFSLRMRNNSSHRVLFVPTVDGLSIMSGKEASFKSSGYIVNSYDSLTIDGWRTSDNNIAEFFFSSSKESYAKKIDKGGNLGVIGCAVFKEKERIQVKIIKKEYIHSKPWDCPHGFTYCTCNSGSVTLTTTSTLGTNGNEGSGGGGGVSPLGASAFNVNLLSGTSGASSVNMKSTFTSSATSSAALGTGFGQDKYSPVVTVDFDKEESPTEVFSIFYNTRHNLEELGVEFRKPVYVAPSAFPSEDGYCKRPD